MFPSSGNNPFPHQFPQNPYILSSSSFGQTNSNFNSEALFHHHVHQTQILNQTFDEGKQENDGVQVPNNFFDGPTTKVELESENLIGYRDNYYQYAPLDIIPARFQQPGKKDRHSKIVTAQGPRDRRVRLSIDIAKRFFGLQDMLGFDKASKTLDWLLTKSKVAIEEVAQSKMNNAHNNESDDNNPSFAKDFSFYQGKIRSTKETNREKARDRARERTRRKKMCILADNTIISPSTSNSNQSLPLSQMGDCKISEVYSNLFPQESCYKELEQIKKNKFISTSTMYDGPSKNSCPQDHIFPCTSSANWDTNTQRLFQLYGQPCWEMSTNHQL